MCGTLRGFFFLFALHLKRKTNQLSYCVTGAYCSLCPLSLSNAVTRAKLWCEFVRVRVSEWVATMLLLLWATTNQFCLNLPLFCAMQCDDAGVDANNPENKMATARAFCLCSCAKPASICLSVWVCVWCLFNLYLVFAIIAFSCNWHIECVCVWVWVRTVKCWRAMRRTIGSMLFGARAQ